MPTHPALRANPLTRSVRLHLSDGSTLDVSARVTRQPVDPGGNLGTQDALAVRVSTPDLPAGIYVEEITVGAVDYTVLDSSRTSSAVGARLDWDSTRYEVRIH